MKKQTKEKHKHYWRHACCHHNVFIIFTFDIDSTSYFFCIYNGYLHYFTFVMSLLSGILYD